MHSDYREELVKLGIIRRLYCSESERAEFSKNGTHLPEDVYTGTVDFKTEFWRYPDISDEQMLKMIQIKNALSLRAMKICAIVVTVIAAIFLAVFLRAGF